MTKVDLHNHLKTRGYFRKKDFSKLVHHTSKGLDCGGIIGITTCRGENMWNYEKLLKYGGDRVKDLGNAFYILESGVLAVKTEEIGTKQGHLLAVGLKKYRNIPHDLDLEETIKIAKGEEGCLVFAQHPFYKRGLGHYLYEHQSLLEKIDGIEIHNGEAIWIPKKTPRNSNGIAEVFFSVMEDLYPHLIAISTSDGHSFSEIGSNYTEISGFDFDEKDTSVLVSSLKHFLKNPIRHEKSISYLPALRHKAHLGLILKMIDWGLYPKPEDQDTSLP